MCNSAPTVSPTPRSEQDLIEVELGSFLHPWSQNDLHGIAFTHLVRLPPNPSELEWVNASLACGNRPIYGIRGGIRLCSSRVKLATLCGECLISALKENLLPAENVNAVCDHLIARGQDPWWHLPSWETVLKRGHVQKPGDYSWWVLRGHEGNPPVGPKKPKELTADLEKVAPGDLFHTALYQLIELPSTFTGNSFPLSTTRHGNVAVNSVAVAVHGNALVMATDAHEVAIRHYVPKDYPHSRGRYHKELKKWFRRHDYIRRRIYLPYLEAGYSNEQVASWYFEKPKYIADGVAYLKYLKGNANAHARDWRLAKKLQAQKSL